MSNAKSASCSPGIFGCDVASGSPAEAPTTAADGGLQCAGWKATSPGLQAAAMSWSTPDYNQQDPSAQTLTYPATPTLTMQTLCPSYTMLTYTHTPLLTNFGVSEKGLCKYVLQTARGNKMITNRHKRIKTISSRSISQM